MNMDGPWSKQEACFACETQVWHVVNQICVIHEVMNGCKNLKNYLRLAWKM